MKKIIALLIFAASLLSANNSIESYKGEWRLVKTCGGIGGGCTNTDTGYRLIISSTRNSTDSLIATYMHNDSLMRSISFKFSNEVPSVPSLTGTLRRAAILGDTMLTLSDEGVIDGGTSYFSKVSVKVENITSQPKYCSFTPNPASKILTVAGLRTKSTVSIYSLNGRLLKRINGVQNHDKINLGNMGIVPGQYILQTNTEGLNYVDRITILDGK